MRWPQYTLWSWSARTSASVAVPGAGQQRTRLGTIPPIIALADFDVALSKDLRRSTYSWRCVRVLRKDNYTLGCCAEALCAAWFCEPPMEESYGVSQEFWHRLALVARASRPITDGPGRCSGYHPALRQLLGVRPYPTELGDGMTPGRCTQCATAAAECLAAGSRVRSGVAGKQSGCPRTRDGASRTRLHAGPAGAIAGHRGRPMVACPARECRGRTADGFFAGPSTHVGDHREHQHCRRVIVACWSPSVPRQLVRCRALLPTWRPGRCTHRWYPGECPALAASPDLSRCASSVACASAGGPPIASAGHALPQRPDVPTPIHDDRDARHTTGCHCARVAH